MTRAEGADAGVVFDDLLELGDGRRFEDIAGVVGQIAGPVGSRLLRGGHAVLRVRKAGEEATGHEDS